MVAKVPSRSRKKTKNGNGNGKKPHKHGVARKARVKKKRQIHVRKVLGLKSGPALKKGKKAKKKSCRAPRKPRRTTSVLLRGFQSYSEERADPTYQLDDIEEVFADSGQDGYAVRQMGD